MNKQETASVLAYFASAWPSMKVTEETVVVWMRELEDIDPTIGVEAMRECVRLSDFPASIAKYRETCSEVARRRVAYQPAPLPQLPAGRPVPPPAEVRQLAQRLRLKNLGGGHWHGGPDPCPVCGGEPLTTATKRHRPQDLPKHRCSRCGEDTLPFSYGHGPEVAPMLTADQVEALGETA